jgi:hypothetical protein
MNASNLYALNKPLNFMLLKSSNALLLRGFFGFAFFYLPSFFFYKILPGKINFIFLNYFFFKSFISHFLKKSVHLNFLYVARIRMRGLGYTVRKLAENLFSFCFFYINFFYLFVPLSVISRSYRKRAIFISNDLCVLNMLIKNVLLLKKVGPYKALGLRYPKQIILLKKRGGKKRK